MKNLSKTISLFALGAGLAFVAPGELPTADNNYSIWAEAGAANIRLDRTRIKKRNNRLYRTSMTTVSDSTDAENSAAIESVDIRVSTLDGQPLVEKTVKKAASESAYFDWVSPDPAGGGIVALGCLDCDDAFNDLAIELGAEADWDSGEIDIPKSKVTVTAWRRGDGSYRFRLKGSPPDISKVGFGSDGAEPAANLSVDGLATDWQFTEQDWEAKLPGSVKQADIDGTRVVISATAYDADGGIIDSSTTVEAVGDTGDDDLWVDYAEFRITGQEDSVIVIDDPSDAQADAALDVRISSETLGTDMVNETAIPATPYRQFTFDEIFFVEADNVVDMEYKVEVAISDELENRIDDVFFTIKASETSGEFVAESFAGELQGYAEMVMNEDGESFTMNIGLLGDLAKDAYIVQPFIEPDDGGSEPEMSEYNLLDNFYLNYWSVPVAPDSFDIMAASDSVSYSFQLSGNGEIQDSFSGLSAVSTGTTIGGTPFLAMEDLEDRRLDSDGDCCETNFGFLEITRG